MSLVLADRVRETTQTTGTGTITLDGAVQGFQSFAVIGNNNTTYYTINRGAEWEVGVGTYYGGTLSRDTVYESSNSNNKVNFSAGSKDVFVTLPSEQAVTSGTDVTFTKVTTPVVQATNSAGLSLKNSAGTTQISMGGGGGDNISLNVSTNLNGTNAQIDISPTGTGHVHMKPTGSGSIEIAPTNVGEIDNMIIGSITPATGTFTTLIGGGGSANYFQTQGSATTKAVEAKALGSDTNIAFVIDSKGTGAIDLAAGSSGVNISNGGTVTAITRTASGTAYTSAPSVAISAPTTAGGVQATATCSIATTSGSTLASGGTGYTVGDTLTVSGGTFTSAATFTVATVSAGVVTSLTFVQGGFYTAFPSNPASTTGGTGTGCTINLSTGVLQSTFTITNAGSGYVEQPTVTFSGGGGSGAAAYATVGSATTIKSIGQILDFATDSGTGFRVVTSGTLSTNYWQALSIGSTPALRSSGATSSSQIHTAGTGSILLGTNGGVTQAAVTHTASAVNYVQVTGATTASKVVAISAQGSDTDVTLSLSPKGAGTIRFGTYTAGVLTPAGYITITDSGGTTRRLLVG
jgi:hypothetical protein